VSNFFNTPGNAGFRNYPPGPHSGVDTDLDAPVAADAFDSRARTSLALGVISLLFGVLTGIPAIWFGQKALSHIDAADGALKGRWAAWAGIVLGCLGVVITVAVWTYLHNR
jgi:hypothetical protein